MRDGSDEPNEGTPRFIDGKSMYQELVRVAKELLDADRSEFLVEENDRLVVKADTNPQPSAPNRSYPLLTGLPGQAYTTGTPFVIDDQTDTRGASAAESGQSSAPETYRSVCGIPIDGQGLLLVKARRAGAFSETDQEIAERLTDIARASIEQRESEPTPALDGGTRNAKDHSELLEEVADILSHDLKNPLSVVQGNLELARETGEEKFFEQAMRALHRIEDLIDGVVFLARTGELVDQMEVINLHVRAQAAWENIQTLDAELELDEAIEFKASKHAIDHLLENLIENAITHAGPSVTVRVGALDNGFYIEDNGPGIPDDDHNRIFERGYSHSGENSGLGLHIVKRIAEAHGWNIQVDSSEEGGARLEFTGVEVVD